MIEEIVLALVSKVFEVIAAVGAAGLYTHSL